MNEIEIEIWRPVTGFEGIYEVSNKGRVRSLHRDTTVERVFFGKQQKFSYETPESFIKQGLRLDGYLDVPLTKDGITQVYCVHRFVAEAFIENPNHYPMVNHIDSNRQNNNVENLEWCTYQHNALHALYSGRNKQAQKVYCYETGFTYPSIHETERQLNLPIGAVKRSIETGKDYGYHFKFKE